MKKISLILGLFASALMFFFACEKKQSDQNQSVSLVEAPIASPTSAKTISDQISKKDRVFVYKAFGEIDPSQIEVSKEKGNVTIYNNRGDMDCDNQVKLSEELGIDVLITDNNINAFQGKRFDVHPPAINSWPAVRVQPKDEPWKKYLWLDDLRSIKKIGSLFQFSLRNGEVIIGEWLQGYEPSSQKSTKAWWFSSVNGVFYSCYIDIYNISSVEFTPTNTALKDIAAQKGRLQENGPVIVMTSKGEVRADGCFMAMTISESGSYRCSSHQFGYNVECLPEDYVTSNSAIPNSIIHRIFHNIPMEKVFQVEFFEKENPRRLHGLKIHLKDGNIFSGYLVTPGTSYAGEWSYYGSYGEFDSLICYQNKWLLIIPFKDVGKISWERNSR